jgi:hypothetical protein
VEAGVEDGFEHCCCCCLLLALLVLEGGVLFLVCGYYFGEAG